MFMISRVTFILYNLQNLKYIKSRICRNNWLLKLIINSIKYELIKYELLKLKHINLIF